MYLHLAFGLRGIGALRADEYSLRPEIEGRYGRSLGEDQFGRTINAAVEIHIGRDGQHVVALRIAHDHHQGVVRPETDAVGDFEGEGRAASAMPPDMIPVDEQIGDRTHAVETHEESFPRPFGRDKDIVLIVARGLQQRLLRTGIGIPTVRQGDVAGIVAAVLRFEEETPALVERENLAGRGRQSDARQQK